MVNHARYSVSQMAQLASLQLSPHALVPTSDLGGLVVAKAYEELGEGDLLPLVFILVYDRHEESGFLFLRKIVSFFYAWLLESANLLLNCLNLLVALFDVLVVICLLPARSTSGLDGLLV